MSVINKMLRDLDEREALPAPEGAPPLVQSGMDPRRRRHREWFWRIVSALMLLAVVWVGWIAYQLQPHTLVTGLAFRSADSAQRNAVRGVTPKPDPAPAPAPPAVAASAPPPAAGSPAHSPVAPVAATPVVPAPAPVQPAQAAATAAVPAAVAPSRVPAPAPAEPVASATAKPGSEAKTAAAAPARRSRERAAQAPAEPVAKLGLDVPSARILDAPGPKARIEKRDTQRTPQQRAELAFRHGVAQLRDGRPSEAEGQFALALEAHPAHEAARQAYVALLIDRRVVAQARSLLEDGLALNPGHPLFSLVLARIRLEEGNAAGALEILDASRGGGTEYAEIQALRGTALHRLGRHPAAADAYRSAIHLSPRDGGAWIGLALSLEAMQKLPEAAEAFRRAAATGTLSPQLQANAERRARQLQ